MNLTHEDIAFLADLRNELLTQPTDGNCDPRFWTVNQKYVIENVEADSADGWTVRDTYNEYCVVGKPNDLASVIAELCDRENGYGDEFEQPEMLAECTCAEELVCIANDQLEDDQFMVAYYRERFAPCPDTLFLTKRACQEHIDKYGYNYNTPHTYVMTAERSPEYARLLEILKRVDWESLPGAKMDAEEPRQ